MTTRVALVTGGTGGIGTAICKRLADLGHKVATNYRNEDKARAWQQKMQADGYDIALVQGRRVLARGRRSAGARGRGQARPGRHPGQQRRHHPRHHLPQDDAAAVERGHQHQPQFGLQHDPAGDRGHARAQVGPRHPDQFDQRPERPVRPGQLRRGQGRHARLHDLAGAGKREVRHHREHGVAGLHRHRHGDGGARRKCATRSSRRSPPAASASPDEIAYAVGVLHPRRGRAGSPAPTCRRTAASTWAGEIRANAWRSTGTPLSPAFPPPLP